MSISGGIKIFDVNNAWLDNGGTIVASTGNGNFAIDKNVLSYWQSVASDDSTVETLTLTFTSCTFSRLLFSDHNWKQYTAKYWNGSSFVNFTSVSGLDGSVSNISETVFADNSSYYEFAAVTTTQIQITVTKTQTANAQKYVNQIVVTTELGTFVGYPVVKLSPSRNQRANPMISGKVRIEKANPTMAMSWDFTNYPTNSTYSPDLDLMYTLFDRDSPFLVWLCGGRRGSTYFKYALRGFRLMDLFYMQFNSDFAQEYYSNVYVSAASLGTITLSEHV